MIKNLKDTLTLTLPLFVNEDVAEDKINFTRVNRETGLEEDRETTVHSLKGFVMTDEYEEGVFQKLRIGISSTGYNGLITPMTVMKRYYQNKVDLDSGKKHILAKVTLNFKGNNGEAFSLMPQLVDMDIVESKDEDMTFINNLGEALAGA